MRSPRFCATCHDLLDGLQLPILVFALALLAMWSRIRLEQGKAKIWVCERSLDWVMWLGDQDRVGDRQDMQT